MTSVRRHFASTIVLASLLTACGEGGGTPTPTPTPTPSPTPAPTATVAGVFVNPAPDPGASDKAAAYIGWAATAGATNYVVRYSVNGGVAATQSVGAVTGATLTGLPQGASLSVTVAPAVSGTTAVDSAAIVATLPRPATTAETAAYNSAAAYSDSVAGEAVVVMRNGQTVYTHYASGYANTAHTLASGTKSFTCALEAFAEQDNYLKLTDNASAAITDWASDANKSKITIQDLLSLQSGLSGNPAYSPLTSFSLDTYQLAVTETDSYAPGQAFIYDPLSFQNFALIFQIRTGGAYSGNGQVSGGIDPIAYLQGKLFTPIGIPASTYTWGRDIKGRPQMGGGASFAATDWIKYGQFVLQRGTWQSSRLLPAATIDYCTGGYKNPAYLGYGLTWWLNAHVAGTYNPAVDQIPPGAGTPSGTDQFAPSAPLDTFMAAGAGNQRLYIIPSQGLVVVRYAPLSSAAADWSDNQFLGKLLGVIA